MNSLAGIKNVPATQAAIGLRKTHFTLLTALYAIGIIYASLIIGPAGVNYVPIGFAHAWSLFLKIGFVDHASNQRADWMSNMVMLIPLAFLLNSALGVGRGIARQTVNEILTLVICIAFILAVKYAQLFFPPRTVTLNYIVAQSAGAAIGVVLFRLSHTRFYPRLTHLFDNGEGLSILLGAYTVWLFAYFLMPFDFALSIGDLAQRALTLMESFGSAPGDAAHPVHRGLLILADTLALVPAGMFLAVTSRERSFRGLILRGFGLILLVTFLSFFVLGATPFAISIVYRTIGIGLGVWFMRKLRGKDLRKRHYYFSRYIPLALPLYVLLVMFASGVLSNRWVTFEQAANALEARQFLPFWNFYIVSKAHATQSLVVTSAIFAPIGVMVWVRRGFWASGAGFSAFLAFCLSMAMEFGRMMKPTMRPDFTDPFIAAAAAAIAFKAMPTLWRMFEREAKMSGHLDHYIEATHGVVARPAEAPPAAPSAPDDAPREAASTPDIFFTEAILDAEVPIEPEIAAALSDATAVRPKRKPRAKKTAETLD